MMNQEKATAQNRSIYLDILRIIAVFLVIVNHTNSQVFQGSSPADGIWYLSVLWYYLSKIAVPIFVMVSGACLLPKVDSYVKTGKRILRMVITLVVFSYLYFLYDALVNYGIWPRAVDFGAFFALLWAQYITDSFWYLYFYIGLLVMLPIMQRLAQNMKKVDMLYLIGLSIAIYAIWPLITHYHPAAALPSYFDVPMFSVYIGLFFAGHYIHQHLQLTKPTALAFFVLLLLSLGMSLMLTHIEFGRVAIGEKYWFMDERMHPSIFTIIAALATMALIKFAIRKPVGKRTNAIFTELGGCTFGIFLLQDFIIQKTEPSLFRAMSRSLPQMPAVILWELLVFVAAFAAAYLLRRIPLFRKIL